MPKEKNKKTYVQKYAAKWELDPLFKGWLKPSVDGDASKAFCSVCKTILIAHKKSLTAHAATSKHEQQIKNQQIVSTLPKLDKFAKITLSQKRKVAELKIAVFIAEHASINAVGHLSEVIKSLDTNSEVLQDIKLHRTKCAALIKNVLSPCILEHLLNDIGDSYYSLVIDESTTIDTKKILCVMIRYFSRSKKKIITTFYRLIEMREGTANAISAAILNQLKSDNLDHGKLLGLGVDGANVNIGAHHSVTTILRVINPDLVVIKCICHSLHLASEEACKVLPRHLDFMVRETHSWFSVSTKRQIEYADVYRTLEGKTPKKIAKLSNTRWLVRLQAVDVILDQWDALKLHFNIAQSNNERCYIALQLHEMFCTPENKLYLTFLSTTLKSIIGLNRLFQSNSIDPVKLFKDLNDTVYSILQMLVVPSHLQKVPKYGLATFDFEPVCMPLDCINFGYEFNALAAKSQPGSLLHVKKRCKEFLIVLVAQLQKRIPENIKILDEMATFSPQSSSSQVRPDITDIATKFKNCLCTDIDSTLKEWNLVHRAEISEKGSTEAFWAEVNEITDAGGNKKYENISKLVLGLLSLPFSNAAIERAFSIVNIIKDKLRNRVSIPMVEAILHVRCTLDVECCEFQPTPSMLSRFKSESVYTMVVDDDISVMEKLSRDDE